MVARLDGCEHCVIALIVQGGQVRHNVIITAPPRSALVIIQQAVVIRAVNEQLVSAVGGSSSVGMVHGILK